MAYIRKTEDEWEVQIYTGSQYQWEMVTTETTYKEAKVQAKCYRENGTESVRIVKKRVPITQLNVDLSSIPLAIVYYGSQANA